MVLSQYPINPTTTSEVHDLSLRKRCRGSRKYRMDPDTPNGRTQSKKSFIKAHYHPFLFATMAFSAMAELGLTAFLVSAGNEHHTWPSARYHSLYVEHYHTHHIQSADIITLQVDTLCIQCSVDDYVLDGIYDVDCRRSDPFAGEHC